MPRNSLGALVINDSNKRELLRDENCPGRGGLPLLLARQSPIFLLPVSTEVGLEIPQRLERVIDDLQAQRDLDDAENSPQDRQQNAHEWQYALRHNHDE